MKQEYVERTGAKDNFERAMKTIFQAPKQKKADKPKASSAVRKQKISDKN